jgi:PAS domain S-box-containing protein
MPLHRSDLPYRPHAELHQSEERFRLLVESVRDYAIFMLDPGGHVVSWNAGAERIKGYAAAEIIGRHFSVFYPPEAVAADRPQRSLAAARQNGHAEDEGWRLRRDGSRFWANVVITALWSEQGELRGFAKVTRDLTERRQKEEAQRVAQLHEEASRLKDDFLAVLSHELRTPLNVIVGEAWRLRHGQLTEDQACRAWDALDRNIRLQARIIDDLLDISRIISGKIALERQRLDLKPLIDVMVDQLRLAAPDLIVGQETQSATVVADSARLQQVIGNLLSNAAKFTPSGGRIDVRLGSRGDDAVLCVEDSGVGIPARFLPHVFDRFSQADASTRRAHGGLGLGLAIVRQLVELHGGTIVAASDGEGRGASFTLTLPIAEKAAGTGS